MINIDALIAFPPRVVTGINALHWENATVQKIAIGQQRGGIFTTIITIGEDDWAQVFGGQALTKGAGVRNFLRGCLEFMPMEFPGSGVSSRLRVGRAAPDHSALILALRPLDGDWPVFWPGREPTFYYLFDDDGVGQDRK